MNVETNINTYSLYTHHFDASTYLIQFGEVISEEGHGIIRPLHTQLNDTLLQKALHLVFLTICFAGTNRILFRTLTCHLHLSSVDRRPESTGQLYSLELRSDSQGPLLPSQTHRDHIT